MTSYVLKTGREGAQRLQLLARLHRPATARLLRKVGLARGMRCLDVGCGIGEVTLSMARAVAPSGMAVGVDLDDRYLALARAKAKRRGLPAEFRHRSAHSLEDDGTYDLVYARCLLSHVPNPAEVVARMVRAVRPGGTVAVEDIDFRGVFCHPSSAACDEYVSLYTEVVRRNGGDAARGADLFRLLSDAGVEHASLEVALPAFVDGEAKSMAAITMQHIRGPVREAGLASDDEMDRLVEELSAIAADSRTILSMPRVFQAWGRRPL